MAEAELVKVEDQAPAPKPERSLVSLIDRVLERPDIDIDKIERFLNMQRQIEADQAERLYNEDFAAMQTELPAIEKRGTSNNGKYAKWEDIQEAILPVTSKFGFAVTHKTRVEADRVIVTCIVRHRDGHQDQTELPLPLDTSGSKNNVQAVGSSVSYGKRYTASALLGIRVDGDDDDGNKAQGKKPSKAKSRGLYADMQAELRQCMNMDALREWDETNKAKGFYEQLPDDWFYSLKEEYDTRKEMFE